MGSLRRKLIWRAITQHDLQTVFGRQQLKIGQAGNSIVRIAADFTRQPLTLLKSSVRVVLSKVCVLHSGIGNKSNCGVGQRIPPFGPTLQPERREDHIGRVTLFSTEKHKVSTLHESGI